VTEQSQTPDHPLRADRWVSTGDFMICETAWGRYQYAIGPEASGYLLFTERDLTIPERVCKLLADSRLQNAAQQACAHARVWLTGQANAWAEWTETRELELAKIRREARRTREALASLPAPPTTPTTIG